LEGRLGQAYNEQAFRSFLAIERKRSERSGCPFLLLLVALKEQSGVTVRIDPMVAPKLFSALWLCLRETDCIGWYREERVAGAVLTERGDRHPTEVCRLIGQRVSGVLSEGHPAVHATSNPDEVTSSPKVDAVAIVTPVSTHYELARKALENGKHVFVEKPFTATSAQAEELIELADRKNLQIMVDHTFLFNGA